MRDIRTMFSNIPPPDTTAGSALGFGAGIARGLGTAFEGYQQSQALQAQRAFAQAQQQRDFANKMRMAGFEQDGRMKVAGVNADARLGAAKLTSGATVESANIREGGAEERSKRRATMEGRKAALDRLFKFRSEITGAYPGYEARGMEELLDHYGNEGGNQDAALIEKRIREEGAQWWERNQAEVEGGKNRRSKGRDAAISNANKLDLEAGKSTISIIERRINDAIANKSFFDRNLPGTTAFYRGRGPTLMSAYGSQLAQGKPLTEDQKLDLGEAILDAMELEQPGRDHKAAAQRAYQSVLQQLTGFAREAGPAGP
jgi:hypothetical protein